MSQCIPASSMCKITVEAGSERCVMMTEEEVMDQKWNELLNLAYSKGVKQGSNEIPADIAQPLINLLDLGSSTGQISTLDITQGDLNRDNLI